MTQPTDRPIDLTDHPTTPPASRDPLELARVALANFQSVTARSEGLRASGELHLGLSQEIRGLQNGYMEQARTAALVSIAAALAARPEPPVIAIVRPGDRLLVQFPPDVDAEDARTAMDFLKARFPEAEVAGLSGAAVTVAGPILDLMAAAGDDPEAIGTATSGSVD